MLGEMLSMEETLMHSHCNYTIYELRSSDWQNTECFGKIENIETRMLTLIMCINIY